METKIKDLNDKLKSEKELSKNIFEKTPKEPILQTMLIFIILFIMINHFYIRPKTIYVKNFLSSMSRGDMDEILKQTSDCTIYNNKNLNEDIKNDYLSQLSYIIQSNGGDTVNNFFITQSNNSNFSFDIKTLSDKYGNLTKNLSFKKIEGTYKFDINSYIMKNSSNEPYKSTDMENKLLMRQLFYCYQHSLDDYINYGYTQLFDFVLKDGDIYKKIINYKRNNLNLSQQTIFLEFNDIKPNKNFPHIQVKFFIKQNKENLISLKKVNASFNAVNINGHWLLSDSSLIN